MFKINKKHAKNTRDKPLRLSRCCTAGTYRKPLRTTRKYLLLRCRRCFLFCVAPCATAAARLQSRIYAQKDYAVGRGVSLCSGARTLHRFVVTHRPARRSHADRVNRAADRTGGVRDEATHFE